MIRAIALDPGRTTGYALAMKEDGDFLIAYGQQQLDHYDFYHFLPTLADHVIYETFRFRQRKQTGVDLYPCELIGVLHFWSHHYDAELHYQEPSVQGKDAYFSNKRLKDMGCYIAAVEHGRSAVKHLLQWFYFGPGARYVGIEDKPELVGDDWLYAKMVGRG